MSRGIGKLLAQSVRQQVDSKCEYCLLQERHSDLPHVIDHVIARQHNGKTVASNLALCCGRCNLSKGPNVAGIDPSTQKMSRLFHPRKDAWPMHFRWRGARLVGITEVGRTTVAVLAINHPYRLAARKALLAAGKLHYR